MSNSTKRNGNGNTANAASNNPPVIDITLSDLRTAFAAEMTAAGHLITAQVKTHRVVLMLTTSAIVDVQSWSARWREWKETEGRDKSARDKRAGAEAWYAEQFGITLGASMNGKPSLEDHKVYDGKVRRMAYYVETCIGVIRHNYHADFMFTPTGGTFIARNTSLGSALWTDKKWDEVETLKQRPADYLIQIVDRSEQRAGGMITWGDLREFVSREVAGTGKSIAGTTPSEDKATDTLSLNKPLEGLTVLSGALSAANVTTTPNKMKAAQAAQSMLEIAFPAWEYVEVWELFNKAFSHLYKVCNFPEAYVAPKGTAPAAVATAQAAASDKLARALDKSAEQRVTDKPATVVSKEDLEKLAATKSTRNGKRGK